MVVQIFNQTDEYIDINLIFGAEDDQMRDWLLWQIMDQTATDGRTYGGSTEFTNITKKNLPCFNSHGCKY